jgi:hypothetical protein
MQQTMGYVSKTEVKALKLENKLSAEDPRIRFQLLLCLCPIQSYS